MYEGYTHQSLPSKCYRELLGTALCVFVSNNAFIIETILRLDISGDYDWYKLTDMKSGQLKPSIANVISTNCGNEIYMLFEDLINRRNRIIHSYRITDKDGEQVLASKEKINKGNKQFEIAEEYLIEFIQLNDKLSSMLHNLRGY